MDDVEIATVRKNAREQFLVAIREFRGRRMIDLRVYADNGQDLVPTPKGVAVKPESLGEIIAALIEAQARAQALGMLGKTEDGR